MVIRDFRTSRFGDGSEKANRPDSNENVFVIENYVAKPSFTSEKIVG